MYRFWGAVIEPALKYLQPKVIIEVGTGKGHHTKYLLKYAKDHGAHLHVVDPTPQYDFERWQTQEAAYFTGHLKSSLNALPLIEQPDLVLIDGDHNWYTVFNELKLLDERGQQHSHYPVIFVHDIDWPYGRRDLYHNPDLIPSEYRHAYDSNPIALDETSELKLTMSAPHAVLEGGPRNGVRTAVEDFLQSCHGNYVFVEMPGFHGLGILVAESTLASNADFGGWLHCLRTNQTTGNYVKQLEKERLALALKVAGHVQGQASNEKQQGALQDSLDQLQAACNTQQQTIEGMQRELSSTQQERDLLLSHGDRIHRTLWWRLKAPLRLLGKFFSYLGSIFKSEPKEVSNALKISLILNCTNLDEAALKGTLESITTQSIPSWEVVIALKADDTSGIDVIATDYQLKFGEQVVLDKHSTETSDDQVFMSNVSHCTGDYIVLLPVGNTLNYDTLERLSAAILEDNKPERVDYEFTCLRHDVISRLKSLSEIESN